MRELRLVGVVLGERRIRFGGRRVYFGEAIDVLAIRDIRSELIGGTFAELREALLKHQGSGFAS